MTKIAGINALGECHNSCNFCYVVLRFYLQNCYIYLYIYIYLKVDFSTYYCKKLLYIYIYIYIYMKAVI